MTPVTLLTAVELVAGGRPVRVAEVERYPDDDPFAHRHRLHALPDRWYFHRVGAGYRGGSFKGLDLTAGDGTRHEGWLLRAVEHPDGSRTDGPSRLVDWLLAATGFDGPAGLDAAVGGRSAWDATSPVHLRPAAGRPAAVVRTARVGLGLKRFRPADGHPAVRWLAAKERYLTDPARTRTGRIPLCLAGAAAGPARWRAWYDEPGEPDGWYGRDLTPEGLCRLLGWAAQSGS